MDGIAPWISFLPREDYLIRVARPPITGSLLVPPFAALMMPITMSARHASQNTGNRSIAITGPRRGMKARMIDRIPSPMPPANPKIRRINCWFT